MTLPGDGAVHSGISLAELTTMRVGGPAERLLIARTQAELVEFASALWADGEPWLLLGGGSNTVVSDEGFPGTVLLVRNEGVEVIEETPDRVRIRVQAGHGWDALVAECVSRGWGGIEALSGIPGLAGAAPVQNIGAYGQELGDVLHSIEFLDAITGEVRRIAAPELELGYRDSAIKQGMEGVVLSIDLLLRPGASSPIRYAQLASALDAPLGSEHTLDAVREAVLRLRASKGMVLDEEDRDTWSAGSFFTNPVVTERFARTLPASAPRFPVGPADDPAPVIVPLDDVSSVDELLVPAPAPAPERLVKLSAAWLIEHAGISRGTRLPGSGAAVSSKHTLAITNRGGANAAQVAELARFIVQRVQQEFGVVLVPEPRLYGLEV